MVLPPPVQPNELEPGLDIPNLVKRSQAGDQGAYKVLVELLYPRLFRQALQLCRSETTADDLVEETFVQAWNSLQRFYSTSQFSTWLSSILFNQFRVWRRKEFRLSVFTDWFGQHQSAHTLNTGFTILTLEERQQALWKCVNRLPKKQAEVLYLRFMESASISVIAQTLRISSGTVKSRLFTALKNLRQMPEIKQLEVL